MIVVPRPSAPSVSTAHITSLVPHLVAGVSSGDSFVMRYDGGRGPVGGIALKFELIQCSRVESMLIALFCVPWVTSIAVMNAIISELTGSFEMVETSF